MTDDLETRLRAAIQAEAEAVDDADPTGRAEEASLPAIRARVRTLRRRRRVLAAAAAVAVVVVGVAALPRLGDGGTDVDTFGPADQGRTNTTAPTHQPATTTTAPLPTSTAPPDGTSATTTSAPGDEPAADAIDPTGPDVIGDGFQPLWPFPTRAAAAEWQQAYRDGGQQPWHLEASETALSFTTGFLGFTEIDEVTSTDIRATDAWIGVGYTAPGGSGRPSTAAVLHLMRWDTSEDSPWEVVGTRDTSLRLETPDYGTTARSPMTVGGYITGVDESVVVRVLQASSGPLGETPEGVPAGGEDAPWETEVTFGGATDPAVTVVAFTGGHVQGVEAFALTGLRTPSG